MADTKISALTAATTPLAGTEVLPIVQSGVTKQVSVADLTAGRAVSALSLTLTNALTAANGGTGQSSYAVGDLLYASTTTALSKLADVATGNALISGGVGVAPSWGKIGLTTHVSGTLGTGNGGTGLASFTANQIFYASSTSVIAQSSNLQFDGTNFSVGGAPNAFAGGYYGLQTKTFAMWSAGGVGGQLSTNLYFNGSNRIYISNGAATEYQQSNGGHYWSTAASGTAGGTVSLTQLMQLAPSGGLSLGSGTDPGAGFLSVSKGALFGTTSVTIGSVSCAIALDSTTYNSGFGMGINGNASNTQPMRFAYGGTAVGSITITASATAFNTSSDYRLKNIDGPLTGSGDFIDALQPKVGTWKVDGSKFVGFLAHEVQEISPSSVVGEKDGEQMQAMEYGSAEFIANIIAELQSLRKRVAQLESKG